jgi:hypothetical protein
MAQKETNAASLMENSFRVERKPIDFGPATFQVIAQFKSCSKPSARKSTFVIPPGFTLVSARSGNSHDNLWQCRKIRRQPWGKLRQCRILTRRDRADQHFRVGTHSFKAAQADNHGFPEHLTQQRAELNVDNAMAMVIHDMADLAGKLDISMTVVANHTFHDFVVKLM